VSGRRLAEGGKPLDYNRTGAIVLAIRTAEGNFDTTPSADDRPRASDTLIVLGSRGQIERLEQLMRGEEVAKDA
jgi:K+/H+ antiporter YhaU regulatory subunit KhtT